jgi:cytochrome c551/c552
LVVGPASHADQRAMAARYLGDQGADEYMAWVTASGEADEQIEIEMTPQTWLTVDYGKPG